ILFNSSLTSLSPVSYNSTSSSIGIIDDNSSPSSLITKSNEDIKVEFVFTVEYNPNLANIKIEGSLIYSGEDSDIILESWKEKKNEKRMQKIQMPIVQKCLIESVILAKEINIIPPVPLPTMQEKKKDYGAMFG
ncbi:hypothetical protein DRN50_06865, partial [Thermococci archaeon]